MKIITLLFILLFSTNFLFAQEGPDPKTINWGISLSPKLTFQIVDDKALGDNTSKLGYSFNGDVYFDINSKLQLRTGLGFQIINVNQIDYSLRFGCDHDGNGGSSPKSSYYEAIMKTYFLEIPFDLKIKLNENENHMYLKAGISNLFKLKTNAAIHIIACGDDIGKLETNFLYNPQKLLLLSKLGLGYEWSIFNKNKLFVESNVEYSINKFFNSVGINTSVINNSRIVNIGLLVGFRF